MATTFLPKSCGWNYFHSFHTVQINPGTHDDIEVYYMYMYRVQNLCVCKRCFFVLFVGQSIAVETTFECELYFHRFHAVQMNLCTPDDTEL